MHLKPNVDFMAFLRAAKGCKDEVFLNTPNGDSLNLHSALCQMIAVVSMKRLQRADRMEVRCENEQDYLLLQDFLTA